MRNIFAALALTVGLGLMLPASAMSPDLPKAYDPVYSGKKAFQTYKKCVTETMPDVIKADPFVLAQTWGSRLIPTEVWWLSFRFDRMTGEVICDWRYIGLPIQLPVNLEGRTGLAFPGIDLSMNKKRFLVTDLFFISR